MTSENLHHIESETDFENKAIKSNLPVIIDFWAEWCGPCRMMGPVFEQLSKDYSGKLRFAKVNSDDLGQIAGRFGIQGIPTLIVINKGKEVDRIVGFAPKEMLKAKIETILKKIN